MEMIQQRTDAWQEQRKLRITGSRLGAILGLSPWQKPKDVLREMVRQYHGAESEFVGGPHIDHGVNNEQRALLCFMRESGLNVEECGFFAYGDFLGASPDGLTSDGGVLELKVPYSLRNGGDFKPLAEQPHYFCQVQLEMLATGRNHAWFAQYIAPKGDPLSHDYVEEKISIERVEFSQTWIDEHLEEISRFYDLCLSELDNEEHLSPLRVCIDSPEAGSLVYELDAIRMRKKSDESREKEIVSSLASMAGGKNALIHGRKLTHVAGRKSVSYAKAISELCPDADLDRFTTTGKPGWRFS